MKNDVSVEYRGAHHWDYDDERGLNITLSFSVPLSKWPTKLKEAVAARRDFFKRRNALEDEQRKLKNARKEIRTALLETAIRASEQGKELSALIESLATTARERLAKVG